MKISLQHCHAQRVVVVTFSQKIDYVGKFMEIINLEGHPNHITESRVTAILLNGWILPIGGVASEGVRACTLPLARGGDLVLHFS